jgi:hypothetical protein
LENNSKLAIVTGIKEQTVKVVKEEEEKEKYF